MSYSTSPKHHAKQQPRVSWGNNSYQVYATTMEPTPHISNRTFDRNYEERRFLDDATNSDQMIEYSQPVKTSEVKEDVNREADDFIKLEHKKLARQLSLWSDGRDIAL